MLSPGVEEVKMTLTTGGKDWLATYAGDGTCFAESGVTYYDLEGNVHTGSTAEVAAMLYTAQEANKKDVVIVAGKTYNDFYAANGSNSIDLSDVQWVGNNQSGANRYCKGAPPPACPTPTASFTVNPGTTITVDQTLSVDASGSTGGDGHSITSYSWSFGDGGAATGVSASHKYSSPGTYTVTLTVTNDCGKSATATKTIVVQEPTPGTYTVMIYSNPSGAQIWVDGKNTYRLTPEAISLTAGSHTIKLRKDGYKDFETTIDVTGDTTYTWTLEPEEVEEEEKVVEIEVVRGELKGNISIGRSNIPTTITVNNTYSFRIHVDNPDDGITARYRVTLDFRGYRTYSFTSPDWSSPVSPGDYVNIYIDVMLPDEAIPAGQDVAYYDCIATLEAEKP